MIIGIDLFHKRIAKKKSCIGFVASMDSLYSDFYSRVLIVEEGKVNLFLDLSFLFSHRSK